MAKVLSLPMVMSLLRRSVTQALSISRFFAHSCSNTSILLSLQSLYSYGERFELAGLYQGLTTAMSSLVFNGLPAPGGGCDSPSTFKRQARDRPYEYLQRLLIPFDFMIAPNMASCSGCQRYNFHCHPLRRAKSPRPRVLPSSSLGEEPCFESPYHEHYFTYLGIGGLWLHRLKGTYSDQFQVCYFGWEAQRKLQFSFIHRQ
ncbi:hypothetical protein BDV96DRAFT_350751 [Lophiotrema nucula]|uniref:Uncharacterized protein n=1 Tax=Lophiotrema nucula TaxID=690887 RepID=A0A6A5ZJ69_9PLEO|nr:hypothetical protein BDV96DRAFT_350751 [Lophiotrema nucula]